MVLSGSNILARLRYSLAARIFVSITAAMIIVLLFFDFLIIHTHEKAVTGVVLENGLALSQLLADAVTIDLYSENKSGIIQAAGPVINQPEVKGIEIFDLNGKVLYSNLTSRKEHASRPRPSAENYQQQAFAQLRKSLAPTSYLWKESFEFWAPVLLTTNLIDENLFFQNAETGKQPQELIGFVRILMNRQKLLLGIKRFSTDNFLFLGSFLLLSALITFVLIKTMTRPLSNLVNTVRRRTGATMRRGDVRFLKDTFTNQLESLEKFIEENRVLKENLEETTREIINVQEQERKRIAYDLHDHIAQELVSIRMKCETLFDEWKQVPKEVVKNNDLISTRVKECLASVRELSYELRPPDLDELGLTQAFHHYCLEFAQENGLTLHFQATGLDNLRLDNSLEINLYRILQEALSNIKRHSQAKNITVKLLASHPDVVLRVEDDGKGFEPDQQKGRAQLKRHMGIQTMRERTHLLNGEFSLRSRVGKGTKIFITIPY